MARATDWSGSRSSPCPMPVLDVCEATASWRMVIEPPTPLRESDGETWSGPNLTRTDPTCDSAGSRLHDPSTSAPTHHGPQDPHPTRQRRRALPPRAFLSPSWKREEEERVLDCLLTWGWSWRCRRGRTPPGAARSCPPSAAGKPAIINQTISFARQHTTEFIITSFKRESMEIEVIEHGVYIPWRRRS